MKKQYFIFLAITCMSVIFSVKAQNTPIDNFLKTYPSREGVTLVSMSQQMLRSIFTPPRPRNQITNPSVYTWRINNDSLFSLSPPSVSTSPHGGIVVAGAGLMSEDMTIPEAYSSVSISKKDIPENLYADFKKTLLSTKYELIMERNNENKNILGYFLKNANENTNEIVILHQQEDQFSAIYIKGDIDINYVNHHLNMIRSALNRMGANQNDMLQMFGNQFAFAIPKLEDIRANLPDFNELKNQMEEFKSQFDEVYKQKLEESMKNLKDVSDDDFHQKIRDLLNDK